MAISKPLFLNFLVICWLAFVGYSQVTGGGEPLPCIQKLMPCQAYLKGSASPAAACCVPLKEMATSNAHCLCAVFNNQAFLKNLNVTQADALNLAKTCGANADISVCSKEAAPSGPPSSPAAPSSNSSETSAPPKKNAGTTVYHVGGSLLLAAIFGIIVSLF